MFIYVLHFDTPLEHARHYTGSTTNLRKRLQAHAKGTGARLTEVIKEKGITWRLASLFQCKTNQHRSVERRIKKQNNGPRYCKICQKNPAVPKGTLPWDIQLIKEQGIPIESTNYKKEENKDGLPHAKRNHGEG